MTRNREEASAVTCLRKYPFCSKYSSYACSSSEMLPQLLEADVETLESHDTDIAETLAIYRIFQVTTRQIVIKYLPNRMRSGNFKMIFQSEKSTHQELKILSQVDNTKCTFFRIYSYFESLRSSDDEKYKT